MHKKANITIINGFSYLDLLEHMAKASKAQILLSTDTLSGYGLDHIFEIAKDNLFSNKVKSEVLTSLSKIVTLEKGFAYYWRVKAKSSKNIESEFSSISQFYTEEIPQSNHLPFAPELIYPFLNHELNHLIKKV